MNAVADVPRRPGLALRVGITGARDIPAERIDAVRQRVADVLTLVRQEMLRVSQTAEVQLAYGLAEAGPELRLLSPLAEGADRIAAETALELGYALHVPMPFAQAEYTRDFLDQEQACSATEFARLLQRAEGVLELDGARDDPAHGRHDEARSYEAVGRLVVRNCDLLIAVWDGKPGKGRGGTADTVRFSANFGPPVWWIHADEDRPPVWVDDVLDLEESQADVTAEKALRQYIANLIVPPALPRESGHMIFETMVHRLRRDHATPYEQWLAETPRPSAWYWTAYHRLLALVTHLDPPWTSPKPPTDPAALYWYRHYRPADDRASEYAARYRSVYVLIFLLAAIAVAFAALAATTGQAALMFILTAPEAAAFVLILVLVIANLYGGWHTRWIDYRLLAELCRKQQSLAPFGWSLPVWAVHELVERAEEQDGDGEEHSAWVAWYFAALMRTAPLLQGRLATERTRQARDAALDDLVQEQLEYHLGRRRQYRRASSRFSNWGEWLFIILLLLVTAKLVILLVYGKTGWVVVLGVAMAVVPALAAASFGIRAYAELELLAGQSLHMARSMRSARKIIESVPPDRPLASQQLGALVYGVATLMLQDVQGWARLFRVKNVEMGA